MPPKVKITKEMIIDAAFEIARSEGAENINARAVSKKLGCSTQPVMYHFKTIEELKKTVYVKADEYHSEYITNIQSENPMKDIGLNYIRFAETEKNLFRFLFQTNEFIGKNISELINAQAAHNQLLPDPSGLSGIQSLRLLQKISERTSAGDRGPPGDKTGIQ